MPRRGARITRRRLLAGSVLAATGVGAGYSSRSPRSDVTAGTPADGSGEERTEPTDTETATAGESPSGDLPEVLGVAVTDFVQYPLSGTRSHVYGRADTQYVVVRVARAGRDPQELRDGLTLTFGGPTAPLAARQPVPWRRETVDVAFAVSKGRVFERGAVRYRGTVLRTLGSAALDRLNEPPGSRCRPCASRQPNSLPPNGPPPRSGSRLRTRERVRGRSERV